MVLYALVILCDHITYGHVTCTVGHSKDSIYKDVLKYHDIHTKFGTTSPCVGLGTYALVILCDHISQTLQTVDMELDLYCWTHQGHAKDLA